MKYFTLIILLAVSINLPAQITNGLVAEYLFSGNTNDSHGTNHGTGTAVYTTDRFGVANRALNADLSTPIILPQNLLNGQTRSVSLWFKADSTQFGGLLGHQDTVYSVGTPIYAPIFYLRNDSSLTMRFWTSPLPYSNTNSTTFTLNNNRWHHVVITGDAMEQKTYLDNKLVGISTGIVVRNGLHHNQIGYSTYTNSWPSPSQNKFDGVIDDVRIYNKKISINLVDSLYKEGNYYTPFVQNTIYVDQRSTGLNDGSSWTNAYTTLTGAFANATDGDEVWVSKGTYKSGTTRNSVFYWEVDSLKVYGGFIGNETSLGQRDWIANPTILSGDIGIQGDPSDNTYTVLEGTRGNRNGKKIIQYALIDGIEVTGAISDTMLSTTIGRGAGVYLNRYINNVDLKNLKIYGNLGKYGAAIRQESWGIPTITNIENVEIFDNIARLGAGFIFVGIGKGNLTTNLTGVSVYNNTLFFNPTFLQFGSTYGCSSNQDQAIMNLNITNCTFTDNINNSGETNVPGLMATHNSSRISTLRINNSIFYKNGSLLDLGRYLSTRSFDSLFINNSIMTGSVTSTRTPIKSNVLTANPLFNNPTLQDYTLTSVSPAVNSGSTIGLSSVLPNQDLAGNPRISGPSIDMGAYEFVTLVSVPEVQDIKMSLYPNPASQEIFIDGIPSNDIRTIRIYNMQGRLVNVPFHNSRLNVSELTTGSYVILITTENNVYNSKFIKH